MKILRVSLLLFFIKELHACADTAVLPDLTRRARNYAVDFASTDVPIVNDFLLNEGWYSVTSQDVTYVMATSNTLPDYNTCGSLYGIYMQGETADIPADTEIDVEACLRSYFDDCDVTYNIKVRNCEGNMQYYLKPTERLSAYCFDPPEITGKTDLSSAPTDVNLGVVTVQPELKFNEGLGGSLIPYLEFECQFTQQGNYFYLVQWYSNGVQFQTLGPATDVSQLIMTETMFIDSGATLGANIQCGVSVSVDVLGIRTAMVFSANFFTGIKFNEETIILPKTSTAHVTFKITVPIGCPHNPVLGKETNRILCTHAVQMFDRDYDGTCIGNADVIASHRCGVLIPTLLQNDVWDPDKEYSMEILTNDKTYDDPTTFTLSLRTQDSGHPIWTNYQPNSVTVIVTDTDVYQRKYCYSHVDPHMKTADGIGYEQQRVGVFVLYKNEAYTIEVQEQTELCNNGHATCACGVIVRAGADIVLFNTCGNLRYIGYTHCNDNGILTTKRINSNKYQVHTPIGTRIDITLKTGYYEGTMNIDIGMAPKDFGNTKGLCGVFDGNTANDLTTSKGEIRIHNRDYIFSSSWQLTNDAPNNMFRADYINPTSWEQDNARFCYCVHNGNFETTAETTCSASDFEGCDLTDTNDVTGRYCTVVPSRRRRSISDMGFEMKRRMALASIPKKHKVSKRSTITITEDEANTTCTNAIQNIEATTNFTSLMAPGETEAKIEQCIFDYIASDGDYAAVTAHVDALNSIVTNELERDPVYVANNTEIVQLFRQQSCPSNCSNRGTCNDGLCQCETNYHSADCSIDERDQLTIEDVTGAGLCDRLHSSCDCYNIQTNTLIETFKFQYIKSTLDSHGNYTLVDSMSGDGDYLSIFEGIVCDDSVTNDQPFVTHYNLSISNDGTTFSEPVEIHVYDSTCQQYTTDASGEYTFSLKNGYCHIGGTCYLENDRNLDNACNMCQSLSSKLAWTYVCTTGDGEDDTIPLIIIIPGVGAGVVLIIVAAIILYCIIKSKTKAGDDFNTEECTPDQHTYARPESAMSTRSQSEIVAMFRMDTVSRGKQPGGDVTYYEQPIEDLEEEHTYATLESDNKALHTYDQLPATMDHGLSNKNQRFKAFE